MSKRLKRLSITLLVCNACSQQQAYEGVRANQKSACQPLVEIEAYQRCMEEARQSYAEYQRQRQALIQPQRQDE